MKIYSQNSKKKHSSSEVIRLFLHVGNKNFNPPKIPENFIVSRLLALADRAVCFSRVACSRRRRIENTR